MEIRIDTLQPIPARIRINVAGQTVVLTVEEAVEFMQVLDKTIENLLGAKRKK